MGAIDTWRLKLTFFLNNYMDKKTSQVSRASYRSGKKEFFFHVVPELKDGEYLNYITQLIGNTLWHVNDMDAGILERAKELKINEIQNGDIFSITDSKGTRIYELKKDKAWHNTLKTNGNLNIPELQEI